MRTRILRVAAPVALFALTAGVVLLINQTIQIVAVAERIHPAAGPAVFWALLAIYAGCAAVPAALFLRLPGPLAPPPSEQSPEFPRHLKALGRRLRANPALAGQPLESREHLVAALDLLGARADQIIRNAASQVFLGTAISQNGSLDALLVLLAQSRMVWRIAHVYHQRPALREMVSLYANVAATAFVAAQIEEADLADLLEPLGSGAVGSAVGAVPGASVLAGSVVMGAANAFLVLRVGIIAKAYCGALVAPERATLRRLALAQAGQMLGSIVLEGLRKLSATAWAATKRRAGEALRGLAGYAREAAEAMERFLRLPGQQHRRAE